ncbi:MAG: TlpA family protein disulfide reductase [Aestuariibaculum sp.]
MKRFIILTVLFSNIVMAQHTIKGVFSPAKDYEVVLLYKVTPTISEYIDNAVVAEDGAFSFTLDSTVTKGVYRVVYAVPQEDFNFDVLYNGNENIELQFNSETGVDFTTSSENKLLASYTNSMSAITHSIGNFFKDSKGKEKVLMDIFKTQQSTQEEYEKLAKGTIALNFIKANKPYTPTQFEDVNTYVTNLEDHYFDYVDFTNKTLQGSNFLEERMLNYIFGVSKIKDDETANYKANIDVFNNAMQVAPTKVKRVLLVSLWEQFSELKQEVVANYISEKYLIPVAKSLNDNDLVETLTLYRDLSLGHQAPDFSFEITKDEKPVLQNLSELKTAQYYVLLFWSSSCSHCLKEVPEVAAYAKNQDKDSVQVIAIGLEEEPYQWKSLTYDLPEFIHVYGENKWDNKIAKSYGVNSTPNYFILDKDKRIVAKPYDINALKAFFEKADTLPKN